jgi:hypothetical protein
MGQAGVPGKAFLDNPVKIVLHFTKHARYLSLAAANRPC